MIRPSLSAARRPVRVCAALALLLLAAGCVTGPKVVTPEPPPVPEGGPPVPEDNEVVLSEGTQVVADAPWGRIKIEAGPGLRRVYSWRGLRRGVVLEPRQERMGGSLGIHFEGRPPVWEDADGLTEVDLEEGQKRFETVDDAMVWMQIRRLRYVWNNSGLVVGWKPHEDTLQVEVWQFYIDGEQPTSLPDADDARITTGPVEVVPQEMKPVLEYPDGRREPYEPEAAPADASKADDDSAPAGECNWFERLFNQCPKADTTESDDSAEPAEPAAAGGADAAESPDADGDDADSTTDDDAAQPDEPESAPRAEIDGSTVNVRSRATTDSDVLFQVRKGDSVGILKQENDWSYVEFDDGRKGWVADFLLKQ